MNRGAGLRQHQRPLCPHGEYKIACDLCREETQRRYDLRRAASVQGAAAQCEHQTAASACDLCRERLGREARNERNRTYRARRKAGELVPRGRKVPEFVRVPCCTDKRCAVCAGTNARVVKRGAP